MAHKMACFKPPGFFIYWAAWNYGMAVTNVVELHQRVEEGPFLS